MPENKYIYASSKGKKLRYVGRAGKGSTALAKKNKKKRKTAKKTTKKRRRK